MISYRDVGHLEGDEGERLQALIEDRQSLNDLPDDEHGIEAWKAFIADCERIGFPEYIVSGQFELFRRYRVFGMIDEAMDAFVRMMQVIHRHGEFVKPEKIESMLGTVYESVEALLGEPTASIAHITRVIELTEAEMQRWGVENASAAYSRALVAAASGDAPGAFGWLERSQSTGSPEWRADDVANIELEIPLIAGLDPVRAAATLERRLAGLGVDPRRIDPDLLDEDSGAVGLLVLLARLYRFTGRAAEAAALVDRLLAAVGLAGLMDASDFHDLVPALEHRPELALVPSDRILQVHPFEFADWRLIAAVGRNRILADPEGDEGALLRALADDAALAFDRRGETDVHRRELANTWWAGLPATPCPAAADEEDWGDVDERAELILQAGWFDRIDVVDGTWLSPQDRDELPVDVVPHDPPAALYPQYRALLMSTTELLEAESDDAADTLADRLEQRAVRLRCATTRFAVPLFHGTRALQRGDGITFLRCYELAQEELLARGPSVSSVLRTSGDLAISLGTAVLVGHPDISLAQIDDLLRTEADVRARTGGSVAPLLLARAEVAAHLGDEAELQRLLAELDERLVAEGDRTDRVPFDASVVELLAPRDPATAARIARRIAEDGDAEQARGAEVWLAWFDAPTNPRRSGARVREILDSVDGDTDEITGIPNWLLLAGLALGDDDPRPLMDTLLAKAATEGPLDIELFAASANLLLHRYPDDPRGPQLHDRALGIARAIDARDGMTRTSSLLVERWFGGGTTSGSAA